MVVRSTHKPVAELFGLPDCPKSGRARLLHMAIELFYTHGFQAVGIDRILAEAGVTKTTFYKHFESKDDLLVAAIRQRDEWESQAIMTAIQKLAGDDPKARLLAFFDVFDVWFNSPDFHGCQFINAAAEFPIRTIRCTSSPRPPSAAIATSSETWRGRRASSTPSHSRISTPCSSRGRSSCARFTAGTTPPGSSNRPSRRYWPGF
jgi:AcrR family transcriptional regulator